MNDDAAVAPVRHKLDVVAYHRMAEAGILREGERIELIDGDLIDMAPISQAHAGVVSALAEALLVGCAGRATVWPQNPIRLDRLSEPQPDLAVLRRRPDFYSGERPGPTDVLLVVELAYSSLRFDRTVKLRLYARAGIVELWIIDLNRRIITAYRKPTEDVYTETTRHKLGDRLALSSTPEIEMQLCLRLDDAENTSSAMASQFIVQTLNS